MINHNASDVKNISIPPFTPLPSAGVRTEARILEIKELDSGLKIAGMTSIL
ncbi:MAG: hypothetical protein V1854_03920 [Methanobacteriota archaeon]